MRTVALAEALNAKVDQIAKMLAMLVEQPSFSADLHPLRVLLIDVLELIERDPGIEAASTDLYEVARDFVAAQERTGAATLSPGHKRMLGEAFARYRERLGSARPSARAC